MIRRAAILASGALLAAGAPAAAQDHSMHGMPMPKAPAKPKPAPAPENAAPRQDAPPGTDKPADAQPMDHGGMDHGAMDHGAMDHGTTPAMQAAGTALEAGDAPAPAPPADHYADRFFPASDMERSRKASMREMGGRPLGSVLFNLAEFQPRPRGDAYRWEGEGWFGGDVNRLTVKSEGEGLVRGGIESAEVQLLYSRAIDPYFNLQAGVRHDFRPGPARTYAALGFEGMAPYMFEVEGAVFLSTRGELLGRLGGYYDQRITQRLILQPRAEFNFSAQDMPAQHIGTGLTSAELGLRLRYEIARRFAPYVGLSWEAKAGRTADYARADGEKPSALGLVAGLRFWF
ncbi:copper resistance protein B [Sphingomonas sp. CBMAI 2297]|uniref:copper resistance protein B n=1 Tax=Sphingomonas sp. CBMAI 2297 TaxID=2991720 RepID=UPI0024570FCD|nr:copper resistance protein B [Sphingomonas sp. CBMAI 2297]MDH4742588.1 copper resistance protein B [Sphingomonas sp. CBMAI 2297]